MEINNYIDRTPVGVPPDWTSEKDLETARAFFDGPESDYLEQAISRVERSLGEFGQVLDAGLAFFGQHTCAIPTGSALQKIENLERIVLAQPRSEQYAARFKEHLAYCRFALSEYLRVIVTYAPGGRGLWIQTLIDLGDLLLTAMMNLEEGFRCEHDDYSNFISKWVNTYADLIELWHAPRDWQ